MESTNWNSFAELRFTFGDVDQVKLGSGNLVTIFNLCGNKFRLIAALHYKPGLVFIRAFLTHQEYDKEQWKLRH